MNGYKILGGGVVYNTVQDALEVALKVYDFTGVKPEIRKVENGITCYAWVDYDANTGVINKIQGV